MLVDYHGDKKNKELSNMNWYRLLLDVSGLPGKNIKSYLTWTDRLLLDVSGLPGKNKNKELSNMNW